ncbi:MAG: methyltransferase domain-containing protein [Methanomicrobiales archaeon]|nr:methyltransferase domain-containing protein [Methanomicrobiales archaeon]
MTTGLKGGSTQDEILAIDMAKLGLLRSDVVADIGCGSGKVSLVLAMRTKRVFAVDRRPEAIAYARSAAERSGVENITFYEGEAEDFLAGVDRLDCAFVGGSGRLAEVLALLAGKVDRTIVVNAVLIQTLSIAIAEMKKQGIFCEAIHVQVARSHDLGEQTMFRPIDPVYIVVGGRSSR